MQRGAYSECDTTLHGHKPYMGSFENLLHDQCYSRAIGWLWHYILSDCLQQKHIEYGATGNGEEQVALPYMQHYGNSYTY